MWCRPLTRAQKLNRLDTCARLLLIAYDRDIPTAWEWLEDRRQARAALNAAMKELADLPPEQAAGQFQRTFDQLSPAQQQHANDILAEAANEAREAEGGNGNGDVQQRNVPGQASQDASTLEAAVKEMLSARDEAALRTVIERHQQELLTGEAASILRYNATHARQDTTQEHGEEIARHLEQLADLLDRIQADREAKHPSIQRSAPMPTAQPTPMHPVTPASSLVVPPPTDQQRQLAAMLLAQTDGQLDEALRRGLLAWMGNSGATATPAEITAAYTVFLAATASSN